MVSNNRKQDWYRIDIVCEDTVVHDEEDEYFINWRHWILWRYFHQEFLIYIYIKMPCCFDALYFKVLSMYLYGNNVCLLIFLVRGLVIVQQSWWSFYKLFSIILMNLDCAVTLARRLQSAAAVSQKNIKKTNKNNIK